MASHTSGGTSNAAVNEAALTYLPLIHRILLTCKFQPEVARLDQRLLFKWASGIEHKSPSGSIHKRHYFSSEALMYEMVMTLATISISSASLGCDSCVAGDFATSSRKFKNAASIANFLGTDMLPSWMAKSSHAKYEKEAPAETIVGTCTSLAELFAANAQQMAVATVLIKPGAPSSATYALLAKLTLGIAERLEAFVNGMRSGAAISMSRMDPAFFTLITFQINVQRGMSLYFLARSLWNSNDNYGVAIAAMSEATVAMRTRTSPTGRGLPDLEESSSVSSGPLKSLISEVANTRAHMHGLLRAWEKDNSLVYFDKVPPSVPTSKAVKAIRMPGEAKYELVAPDPLPLCLPGAAKAVPGTVASPPPPNYEAAVTASDADLARDLHNKLNWEDQGT